ncbi:ABC transporter permease [Cellulosilyticum sp. I15G10I2]|uniref:ABC transporter permease n=1 Tax=Cellulosilyticum sp. I15G10I2 TaxID=1892843 RepID=UPI000ABCD692|nr:ABC transporter permease [Cellulosilyticum sp. I15G10I2]
MVRVRVVKAKESSRNKKILIQTMAIIAALLITGIFILTIGHNPINVYRSMIEGSFGSAYRMKETIIKAVPLLITALGIAVAFRMKFWNIGAEGQITMGAFGAAFIALNFGDLPKPIMLITMVLAAIICGGIWAFIPGYLKAKWSTNESIVTLMMNYIAIKWVVYLQYGPWKDKASLGFPKIANFPDAAILPKVFGVHIGWIIALILVVVIHIFIHYTKKGYEIVVFGESENTARYAGMDIKKIILLATFLSGGIAGWVGMIQSSAVSNTLNMQIAGGVGYTAIIVAWLSGLSAPWMVVVSLLFAALTQGGSYIQTAFQIPQSASDIIQALILFCVLGSQFFLQYKVVFDQTVKAKKEDQQGGKVHGN